MKSNPFEVTKAVDFTDDEIATRYVRFSDSEHSLVDPRSSTAQYLVGGKGGGRTHLMRYYSYPLQKNRADRPLLEYLGIEGYIGIYAPASGLDGSRFSGSRIPSESWSAVFAQALEIRLSILLVDVLADIEAANPAWSAAQQSAFVGQATELFHGLELEISDPPLDSLRNSLAKHLRAIDIEVNNAPLSRKLNVDIAFNAGSLLFGIGTAARDHLPGLSDIKITYMLDELENLTSDQQMFVNTLVREKRLPTTFLIGAREWGLRTFKTLSAGEENRDGSEYHKVVPEDAYSKSEKQYTAFCLDVISKRLSESGLSDSESRTWSTKLNGETKSALLDRPLLEAIGNAQRRHLVRLRDVLGEAGAAVEFVEEAVAFVRFDDHPLLEKLAILHAYQNWSSRKKLSLSHFSGARSFIEPLADSSQTALKLRNYLNLWKHDMAAQIYESQNSEQPYSGIDTLIRMSGYLPRSLLVTLKSITARAEWRGEKPFGDTGGISIATQSAGVREASAWYLNDARPLGQTGTDCDRAIRRFASLLQDIRYSDKPSEVNVTSFSSSFEGADPRATQVVEECVKHRLLLEVAGGRQARNRGSVHRKYQLHPMLAPFFGLGLGRRGDLSLSGYEVSTVFSPDSDDARFRKFAKERVAPMLAPFSVSDEGFLFDGV